MNYKIISDGCCDLSKDIIEKYQLHIIPFYISFDDETYYKEIEEIGIRDVYERMVNNPHVYPKTSLPSVQNYIDAFMPYVNENVPVICICFTPSLSGSYNSACNAREIVCEEHPEAKITVINSEAATVSQGLMVIEAGRMCMDNVPYDTCVRILEEMKKKYISMKFAIWHIEQGKGERDYKNNIKLLDLTESTKIVIYHSALNVDGAIEASGIGRSRKKTVLKTISLMEGYFKDKGESMEDYSFAVGYGYDMDEGRAFYDRAAEKIHASAADKDISFIQIGATIAVHTGPHAIGIGIIKQYEHFL